MYLQLFSLVIFYAVALALYRIFFHPLRRYPGPVLAAVTDWYEAYYNIIKKGGLLLEIERLHELHGKLFLDSFRFVVNSFGIIGPVIRVGPNTVKASTE